MVTFYHNFVAAVPREGMVQKRRFDGNTDTTKLAIKRRPEIQITLLVKLFGNAENLAVPASEDGFLQSSTASDFYQPVQEQHSA